MPRPQFADIDGDGDLDLFLQEYSNSLWHFENTGTAKAPRYQWRTDRFQSLDIGEWYRFVDINGDGLLDLLAESPISHIRLYRNTGTKTAPILTSVGELKDAAGASMFMDRQNIPAIADLDCDGRLDMLVGRVEGVVDRYEATAPGADSFATDRGAVRRHRDYRSRAAAMLPASACRARGTAPTPWRCRISMRTAIWISSGATSSSRPSS